MAAAAATVTLTERLLFTRNALADWRSNAEFANAHHLRTFVTHYETTGRLEYMLDRLQFDEPAPDGRPILLHLLELALKQMHRGDEAEAEMCATLTFERLLSALARTGFEVTRQYGTPAGHEYGHSTAKKFSSANAFAGLTFCVSGAFNRSQGEMKEVIMQNGGTISATPSKACDYLVAESIGSSKSVKAEKEGMPIVTEAWVDASIAAGKPVTTAKLFLSGGGSAAIAKKAATASDIFELIRRTLGHYPAMLLEALRILIQQPGFVGQQVSVLPALALHWLHADQRERELQPYDQVYMRDCFAVIRLLIDVGARAETLNCETTFLPRWIEWSRCDYLIDFLLLGLPLNDLTSIDISSQFDTSRLFGGPPRVETLRDLAGRIASEWPDDSAAQVVREIIETLRLWQHSLPLRDESSVTPVTMSEADASALAVLVQTFPTPARDTAVAGSSELDAATSFDIHAYLTHVRASLPQRTAATQILRSIVEGEPIDWDEWFGQPLRPLDQSHLETIAVALTQVGELRLDEQLRPREDFYDADGLYTAATCPTLFSYISQSLAAFEPCAEQLLRAIDHWIQRSPRTFLREWRFIDLSSPSDLTSNDLVMRISERLMRLTVAEFPRLLPSMAKIHYPRVIYDSYRYRCSPLTDQFEASLLHFLLCLARRLIMLHKRCLAVQLPGGLAMLLDTIDRVPAPVVSTNAETTGTSLAITSAPEDAPRMRLLRVLTMCMQMTLITDSGENATFVDELSPQAALQWWLSQSILSHGWPWWAHHLVFDACAVYDETHSCILSEHTMAEGGLARAFTTCQTVCSVVAEAHATLVTQLQTIVRDSTPLSTDILAHVLLPFFHLDPLVRSLPPPTVE